ncbi:SOSS complex subunit B like [Pseudolycoriella hygida]|uniref:SOSS complex subunit B like n=1 Tax=Pseudolycoriella hygida TaxID=35572 RepID=A0A9Q0MKU0_9DIPT|nr:SOSS complex subunit B like [Pseudolycoriella hygida]
MTDVHFIFERFGISYTRWCFQILEWTEVVCFINKTKRQPQLINDLKIQDIFNCVGIMAQMCENIAIKDIRPGMKNINVVFIVLDVGPATLTKENREVRTFKVADHTAAINVSVWDEPGKLLVPGDIVRLTKGYAAIWRSCLTLYSGKNGDIHRIGDFCMSFNEQLNMSEPNLNFQMNPMSASMPLNNGNQGNSSNNGGPMRGGVSSATQSGSAGNISAKGGAGTVAGRESQKSSSSSSSSLNAGKNNQRGGRGNQTRSNIKSDRR